MGFSAYKSGSYKKQYEKKQYQYQSLMPAPVNPAWEMDDSSLILLLSKADNKLGELNAFSQLVPDIDFFIKTTGRKYKIASKP